MSDMKVRLRLQAKDDGLKATVQDAAQSVDELSQSSEKLDKETKQATSSQDKFGDSAKKSGKKIKDASDSNVQASKSTADFSSKLKGGAVTAGVWAAATVAAGVAAAGMVAIVRTDAIREINNLSDTLNVSTASLTEWQYAASQMGLESDKVGDIFKDVSDKVGDFVTTGGGEAADIFENLNVQVKELQNLSPDEQLLKIAGALDDVNRNQQIFFLESIADDASRLLPLLDNGAQRLIAMRREAQVLGVSISDIDADVVSQAAGEMSRLKALGEGTANSLAIEFAPILSAVSGGIVDWVVQAGGFRDAIGWAVDGSVSAIGFLLDYGRMVEIWLTGITSYALQFATYATEGMDAYADAISSVINTALYPFQQAYSYVFDGLAEAMRRVSGWAGPFSDEFEAAADMLDAASIKVRDFRVEAEDVAQVNDAIAASYQTVSDRLAELLESEDPSVLLKENLADLRAEMEETAKANQALQASQTSDTASKATIDANQKIIDSLREELELLGMTERERAIARQTNQLDINDKIALTDSVKAQIVEVEVLAGKIYDLGEAQKAAAKEQEDFKKQLDDANTAAQRFLQDGNLGEIDGLESIQEQLQDAMSVKGITEEMQADFSEAIDQIQSRIGELKFNNMVDGLSSGISALQGLTEQGSDSYEKMQIALTAFNVVQGISAVLKQLSEGDPYTAFARAGATLAAVAQLGVAINGGGGLDVSAQRQASQGTGTVLGDASAKSESILKSNELIAEAVEEIVGINRSMLDALLNLEVSINGAALQITRRWDDTVLAPQAVELGGISSVSGLFSSISESLNILDLGGLIADIAGASVKGKDSGLVLEAPNLTNISAQSYATWEERKNWLDDYDTKWLFTDLDPQITQQLRLVIGGISDSVRAGAEQLNMSGDAIDQAIQSFALERTLISLKGLTADEQQEELQAVFSAMFDDMSMHVMPWLVEFQQAGEGLGETLSRLATEASAVENVVGMLGLTFGDVDDKLRAQTNLVSAMGGLEEFVSAYSSFSDKFLSEEQQFTNARDQLQSAFAQYDAILPASREDYLALVQAQDAATDAGAKNIAKLFELSTAADEYYSMLEDREDERQQAEDQRLATLRQNTQQYQSLFYSEAEKTELLRSQLTASFAELNLQVPETREQFRELVDSFDTTSEASEETYNSLLELAPAFSDLHQVMVEAAYSADNLAERIENALNPKTDQQVQNEALGALGFGGLSIEQAMAQLNALGTAGLESLKSQLSLSDAMFEETVGTIINAYNNLQDELATAEIEKAAAAREQERAAIDRSNALLEQRNKALEEEQARLDALAGIDQGFARLGLTFEEVMTQAIGDMIDNVQDRLAQMGGTDGLLESGVNAQLIDLIDTRTAINRASSYESAIEQIQSGVYLANAQSALESVLTDRDGERDRLRRGLNFLSLQDNPRYFDSERIINPSPGLVDAIEDIQSWMASNQSFDVPTMDQMLAGFESSIADAMAVVNDIQSGQALDFYEAKLAEILATTGVSSVSGLQLHDAELVGQIRAIEASFGGLVRFLDDNGNVLSDIANELSLSQGELDQLAVDFRNDFQDAFASAMDIDLDSVGDVFNNVAEKWADVIYTQEERLDIQLEGLRDQLVAFDELGVSSETTVEQFKELFETAQQTASGAELGQWWAAADVFADINTTLNAIADINPEDVVSDFPQIDTLEQYLSDVYDYAEQQLKSIEQSYREQLRTLEEQARIGKELRDYVTQIRISDLSPDGPAEKLNAAQENLAALMVKAEAGDLEAASKLQNAADSYLTLADAYYGRTDTYTDLFNEVTQSLDNLGIDFMDAATETVIERLNADMLAEQQQIKNYAQQQLNWAINQSNQLTGISGLLSDWPDTFEAIMETTADLIGSKVAAAIPRPSQPEVPRRSTGFPTQPTPPEMGYGVIDGSHYNGADNIPYDNYHGLLHKNEMVLTADVANHVRRSMANGSNNNTEAMVAVLQSELVQLRASVDQMTQTTVQTSKTAEGQRSQQLKATEKVARNQRPKVGLNA